ncbi:putative repetitive proline-rich cell wall protein [Colletotrichum sublineola]|uniref:Putative repetitive proline-rich cell wall protein n=1 Tax=Colletotrichum sublineola TaxID=1173701 RepID=A0A066X2T7_COLSU|nr:putative repetitive proline-rich cell wall protein [Colletotrichum sublineola]
MPGNIPLNDQHASAGNHSLDLDMTLRGDIIDQGRAFGGVFQHHLFAATALRTLNGVCSPSGSNQLLVLFNNSDMDHPSGSILQPLMKPKALQSAVMHLQESLFLVSPLGVPFPVSSVSPPSDAGFQWPNCGLPTVRLAGDYCKPAVDIVVLCWFIGSMSSQPPLFAFSSPRLLRSMRFITALLALAATVPATEDHDHGKGKIKTIVTEVLTTYTTICPVTVTKPGPSSTHYEIVTTTSTVVEKVPTTIYETLPGHTDYVTKTEVDYTTYTSLCPVTETVTGDGHTYTKTYTTVSTIVEKVPTKVWETIQGPTVTVQTKEVEYTTMTSLCPITETKTVGGETVVVTWISTSTIVTQVPTKVEVYTTVKTTQHLSTEVYETVTKPVTTYQTIEHGETHWVTATGTKTITVEKVHTITEVLVETKTEHVEVTQAVTVGGEDVVTQKSWVYVTVSGTVYATQTRAPNTVVVPTTSAVTIPAITVSTTIAASTAPVVVPPNAADARKAPAAVVLAGIFGAVALL